MTYERQQTVAVARFYSYGNPLGGIPNPANKLEWDNSPAKRCYWYQVQKVVPAGPAAAFNAAFNGETNFRCMVVSVNRDLISRTPLTAGNPASPFCVNAALIAPNVVNVIPQTIFVRQSVGP